MANLVDEVNDAIISGKDVTKEMNGRYYRQMFDEGYMRFGSFDSKNKVVNYTIYEPDGDSRFWKDKLDNLKRFERIESPKILPKSPSGYIPKNPNWAVDIGD